MPPCQFISIAVWLWLGFALGGAAQAAADGPPAVRAEATPDADSEQADLATPERATARIYQLAQGDDLATANRFANDALARFPGSASLWEAAGYVRRGAGDYAGALDAYRHAAASDPKSPNAIKGQALMLQKLGAIAPAADLVAAHPELGDDADLRAILAEQAALELRYADSVEDRDERRRRLEQAADKLDQLIRSGGGEIAAARRGETPPFDRIQADVLLHHEREAVGRYERLTAAGVEVPPYARYQAALAYARLRQPNRAIPVLEQIVRERPDDLEAQLELFYALVDADRLTEASERIDRLEQRLSAEPGHEDDLVRVRIAAAMARAYDEQAAQALSRLDHLLEEAPFNSDARADRASVYYWRGWTRRARDEADAVLTVAPRNADARALQIQTDMALDDWRSARAALASETAQDLRERDLTELRQRLSWHDRPEVTIESGYGTGSQTNVATYRDWFVDTRVATGRTTAVDFGFDDRYRLFAHLRQTHTDISPSALVRTWGGAGVELAARTLSGSLEVAGVQGEPAPAAVVRTTWQPADGVRLGAQAATSDPDTPARASVNDIRERTVQLSSGYDWNESTGVGADFGYGHFTDTNDQLSTLLRFSQRLTASARTKLSWNTYVGYTHNTLEASRAPYFDPAHATSEDTELRGEWLARRDAAARRSLWHIVTVSVGSYQQSGFGAHATWAARYEQRWSLSDHSEVSGGITRSEHPYDGNPESRTAVTVNYEGRF